eukprot:1160539-Pelagomonas_calceolata.AAC.3
MLELIVGHEYVHPQNPASALATMRTEARQHVGDLLHAVRRPVVPEIGINSKLFGCCRAFTNLERRAGLLAWYSDVSYKNFTCNKVFPLATVANKEASSSLQAVE